MKKKILCMLGFLMLFSGCAKRESDITSEDIVVQETSQEGEQIKDTIGEPGNELIIDAVVSQKAVPIKGNITLSLPDVKEIERKFLNGNPMKEIGSDTETEGLNDEFVWVLEENEMTYTYTRNSKFAIFATNLEGEMTDENNYTDTDTQQESSDEDTYTDEDLKQIREISNQTLSSLDYSFSESYVEYTAENDVTIYYNNLLLGLPVVDDLLGVDYTHVEIIDKQLAQFAVQERYEVIEEDTVSVITVESAIQKLKNKYADGTFQIIPEKVNRIELMYYINENKCTPVWVFMADPYDTGRETVILYIDATTGELLYDVTGAA